MSDQGKQPESDADDLESDPGTDRMPESVLAAVRATGKARGWDVATNPLYSTACVLARLIGDPYVDARYKAGLSTELRQCLKALGVADAQAQPGKESGGIGAIVGRLHVVGDD